ncbi:MAG TPA: maleylpyruvate isomerase N-terminal domain-containing protein [Trebonia sp.]
MTDPGPWLRAVRASHDRLTRITNGLGGAELRHQSRAEDWSIAQVLSHLGSQAEIFTLFLDAGLTGGEPPSPAEFGPIWDVWNARSPEEQAAESVTASEAVTSRMESLSPAELESFRVFAFGAEQDAAGLLGLRLAEHAVHTWDVAAALDVAARISQDAVDLLIDGLPETAAQAGKRSEQPAVIAVTTTNPARQFTLDTGGVRLEPGQERSLNSLTLTGEALMRLVYGRLDESSLATGEVAVAGVSLPDLLAVFPGF